MRNLELKCIELIKKYFSFLLIAVSVYAGISIRKQGMDFISADYTTYLQLWYENLKVNAGFKGLALDFYTYYIPYMCILAIATYIEEINLLLYIKIISIVSEFVCALLSGMIGYHLLKKEDKGNISVVIAALLLSPSIMLNGAYWGQCDYIYIAFILGSILLMLYERSAMSFVLLGIAFCFKLQTVFILPAYALYYICKRKFSFLNFLIIPVCYLIGGIPAILAGRPAKEVYGIYFGQTNLFDQLSMNTPNIWRLFPNHYYEDFYKWGIWLTATIFLVLAYFVLKNNYILNKQTFLMVCLCSSGICVMFLPGMHERYTALFVLLAYLYFIIYDRRRILIPIALDLITCMTYCLYLYGLDFRSSYPLFAVINLGCLGYIIRITLGKLQETRESIE